MGEILVSATLLILVIMILRRLSRGRISMRFRYALWLIVAVRLVLPVSFGSSPFSVLNLMPKWPEDVLYTVNLPRLAESGKNLAEKTQEDIDQGTRPGREDAEGREDDGMSHGTSEDVLWGSGTDQPVESMDADGSRIAEGNTLSLNLIRTARIRFLAAILWAAGFVSISVHMMVRQRRLVRYLRGNRTEVSRDELPGFWGGRLEARRMKVYLASGLPSPCLVGHDIYIEPGLLKEGDRLQHILAHEYTHAVQGDAVWAFVRSLLCAVYWFYPLIWLAAYEAKKDSELSCDEYAIRILGETERFAYGRTLLAILAGSDQRAGYTGTVLIVDGRENSVKERIDMIAGKRKTSRTAAAIVVLTAVCVCGCTFTGAASSDGGSSGNGKQILMTNEGSLSFRKTQEAEKTEEEQTRLSGRGEDGQQNTESQTDEEMIETEQQSVERARMEEYERDIKDRVSYAMEAAVFREVLDHAEDSELVSAEMVDLAEYYDYLYEGAEFPLTDGTWYKLRQTEETGIDFYGLYTQDYGFRGLKIKVGEDINTFDEPWLPVSFGVDAAILEEDETDGMPRSFAFRMCIVNNGNSEIWRLYVADRYENGVIKLNCFDNYDCWEQLKNQKVTLSIDQEARKVNLVYDGDIVVGTVDISDYAGEKIEEAVWDEGAICFRLEEDGRITFLTGIGLKAASGDKTFYKGLSLIGCPVEIGDFGNREFTMGRPYVTENYFSVRLNS